MRTVVLALLGACSFTARPAALGDSGPGDAAIDTDFQDAPSPLDAAPADWWDPTFRWRIPLTITTTGALPMGYQVGLQFDLDAAPCSGPRDAIRIVRMEMEQPRVIDEVGTAEWTWFPLAAPIAAGGSSTEYWLYCGNSNPPAAPKDPAMVFDFYDGFDTAIDPSVWTQLNSAVVTNGQLVTGGGNVRDNGVVTKTKTFPANRAVDFVATAQSATQSDWWAGFQNGTMDVAPWLHWYTKDQNAVCPDFLGNAADQPWYGTDIPLDTAPHLYTVENYGTKSMYRRADVPVESHIYAPMQPPPAMVNVRLWDGSATTKVSYDWVRVRKAIDPPPAVTAGTPESY